MQPDLFEAASVTSSPPAFRNYLKAQFVGERSPAEFTERPETAARYWFCNVATMPIFDLDKEHLAVVLMNTKYRAIGWNLISIGSHNETVAHPREILRPAIAAPAYGFVLMHNHPSGDTSPSQADTTLTRRLNSACEIMNIRLIDHVIVGRTGSDRIFSFREAGII